MIVLFCHCRFRHVRWLRNYSKHLLKWEFTRHFACQTQIYSPSLSTFDCIAFAFQSNTRFAIRFFCVFVWCAILHNNSLFFFLYFVDLTMHIFSYSDIQRLYVVVFCSFLHYFVSFVLSQRLPSIAAHCRCCWQLCVSARVFEISKNCLPFMMSNQKQTRLSRDLWQTNDYDDRIDNDDNNFTAFAIYNIEQKQWQTIATGIFQFIIFIFFFSLRLRSSSVNWMNWN